MQPAEQIFDCPINFIRPENILQSQDPIRSQALRYWGGRQAASIKYEEDHVIDGRYFLSIAAKYALPLKSVQLSDFGSHI